MIFPFYFIVVIALLLRVLLLFLTSNFGSYPHGVLLAIDLLSIVFTYIIIVKKIKIEKLNEQIIYLLFNPVVLYLYTIKDLFSLVQNRETFATLDAYNFWGIVYGNEAIADSLRVSGFSIRTLGWLFFGAFLILSIIWFWEKRNLSRLLHTLSLIFFSFFLFTSQRSQVDVFLLFPLLALLISYNSQFKKIFWTVSFLSILNYVINQPFFVHPYISFFDNWFVSRVASLSMFISFVWMYFYGRDIILVSETEMLLSGVKKKISLKRKKITKKKPKKTYARKKKL